MTIVTGVGDVDLERDRSLVLMAQAGDDSAFAALYARYFRRLVRFAAKRVGNATEAEEIAQEAFTRAYRALPTFAGDRRFYPWLCVITARLCIDSLRREGRCQVGVVTDEAMIDQGYERLEREGDVARVVEAMGRLTPRHREVLELRERHGWSYHHIATHYEVSLGTVEALLWRARKALRREYEGLGAIALSIPGVRRLATMWRSADSGQSAATIGAFGTAAALTIFSLMAPAAPATTSGAAAAAMPSVPGTHVLTAGNTTVTTALLATIVSPAGAPGAPAAPALAAHVQRPATASHPIYERTSEDTARREVTSQPVHVAPPGVPVGVGADPPLIVRNVIGALSAVHPGQPK